MREDKKQCKGTHSFPWSFAQWLLSGCTPLATGDIVGGPFGAAEASIKGREKTGSAHSLEGLFSLVSIFPTGSDSRFQRVTSNFAVGEARRQPTVCHFIQVLK